MAALGFVVLFPNCGKEDNNEPSNPTNGKTTAIFNSGLEYGSVTDQDGNTYKTIRIGTQTWMAENLRTTRYRNGDPIPFNKDTVIWENLTSGVYCNSANDTSMVMIATYGRLYNWYAVSDSRNIAPPGWHVATSNEFSVLIDYLGGSDVAGGKLKEAGTSHWELSIDASNESGFTALPGGYRHSNGFYYPFGLYGFWWSASEVNSNEAFEWSLVYNGGAVYSCQNPKGFGCTVRCVKD